MSDSFTMSTFFLLFGCLLTGVLFAWLLYRGSSHLDRRVRAGLTIARMITITAIGFLLFFPLVRRVSYSFEKPVIVIGQDNSLSAGSIAAKGFDRQKYQRDLQQLAAELKKSYEVKIYNFSDSTRNGFDFDNKGKLTNGFRFISQLNSELLNRNVGAVILASDGIFNRGGSPLYDINKLKAPFYTIALGDTIPKKDLLIVNINHNSLVYLDNEFTLEVQIQAYESKGGLTRLSVSDNGKQVHEEQVVINSNAFVRNIPVKLKASKLGLQKFTVQLSPVGNEISESNNRQQVVVEVIDARQKVLIAAAGPHPDIAALKQAITLNKYYDLKVVLGDELNAVSVKDYSLVILYQLPGIQNDGNVFLAKLQQSNVAVWYILGVQTNLYAFNQFQKLVAYNGNSSVIQESFADVDPNFTSFDLKGGAAAKVIDGFDPLQMPFGKPVVAGNSSVALSQRIGKVKTGAPLLFFINDNGRKSGYLIGEGIWRWRLSEAQQESSYGVFNNLISNTVQYLAVKDDKRKFKVYTAKSTFDENENVFLNAVLYNDNYETVNTPDIDIELKNGTGKTYKFLFSRTGSGYELDAGALPPGSYTYAASVVFGNKKYAAKGVFYVNELLAEFQQTTANHQLLNAMSGQTNGKMYMPQQLLNILKDVSGNEQIKTLSYEDRKYEELINFKWLFALIMVVLSLEWFFRKRNGEI
jgi:hypothetical protein